MEPGSLPTCEERDRLLDILIAAAEEFASRAEDLKVSDQRYPLVADALERAREEAERAHRAYFAHREEHGC
jgi:hypothetical protein